MSTEEQHPPEPPSITWPDFESVYERLEKLTENTALDRKFPDLQLKNRLINIGLREFLEVTKHGKERGRALELFGFPFKFVTQLDEAILATAQFLSRFRDEEGSTLHLCALHRLSKGEEKSLAFWQSPKAKLYIELQNIILLLNEVGGRTSTITRIFGFSKVEDIAFLTQPAISVLSEQLAAGIKIGFLFLDTFDNKGINNIGPISNAVLFNFTPSSKNTGVSADLGSNEAFNFFALRGVLEEKKAHDLPYQDRCTSKWYTNEAAAVQERQMDNFIRLFSSKWGDISYRPKGVCAFPETGGATFNRATLMMYQAFNRGTPNIKSKDFRSRINETVITRDLIRLERAMTTFDDDLSKEIQAVDATSVKDTLRIHESNPTYRQWLRRSLSRVLAKGKSLSRIYILEDTKEEDAKAIEYQTLAREIQYYLDYLNYEILEMTHILRAHTRRPRSQMKKKDTLAAKCNSFEGRIRVYVTTSSILNNFAERTLKKDVHPVMIKEILRYSPDQSGGIPSILKVLPTLDYLFTKGRRGMIYNFLNQRADPGELRFEASLYRASFDIEKEISLWFGFLNSDDTFRPENSNDKQRGTLKALRARQEESRVGFLTASIAEYSTNYDLILAKQLTKKQYKALKEKIASVNNKTSQWKLLDLRRSIEATLHQYFAPRFSHLFEMLKYHSVEVDLFPTEPTPRGNRRAAAAIGEIYPFNKCKGTKVPRLTSSDQLHTLLTEVITERLKDPRSIPRFKEARRQENKAPREKPRPSIGIITALPKEYVAVGALLERAKNHSVPGKGAGRSYRIGEIPATDGKHSIALALLQDKGNNSAATRATRLLDHFPTVNTIIMVGIAGGVPFPERADEHVRLGDIVVSDRVGVVKYDYVKESHNFVVNRHAPRPPKATLIEAVQLLKAAELEHERPWLPFINRALKKLKVNRPSKKTDILTSSSDPRTVLEHPKDPEREGSRPRIFSGPIASADKLLKDPVKRDQLRKQFGAKAIEMEGSGIADATWELESGYLVVRGICDYCDANKGDAWQKYAAIVAAAYTRSLLESMSVHPT